MTDQIPIEVQYEDFHAYHDFMSKTLQVTGVCHIKGGGFEVMLQPAEKPTANLLMFDLDLVFIATAESESTQSVSWRQPWDDDGPQYTEADFFVPDFDAPAPPPLTIEEIH